MSKRFGRNQRRRAREAIAEGQERIASLEAAMTLDRALLANQRRKLADADDYARSIAQIVGREAIIAGVPVALHYNFERYDDSIQFVPRQPFSAISYLNSVDHAPIEAVRSETLHLLDVDAVAETIRHQVHARVKLAGATAMYTISATALRRMPLREIAPMIANEIADCLVRELKRYQR